MWEPGRLVERDRILPSRIGCYPSVEPMLDTSEVTLGFTMQGIPRQP